MAKPYEEYLDTEDLLELPDTYGRLTAQYHPLEEFGVFVLYYPKEMEELLRPFDGHVGLWPNQWANWPELQSGPDRDLTEFGIKMNSRAGLVYIILAKTLGVTTEWVDTFVRSTSPVDGSYANATDFWIRPSGEEQNDVLWSTLFKIVHDEGTDAILDQVELRIRLTNDAIKEMKERGLEFNCRYNDVHEWERVKCSTCGGKQLRCATHNSIRVSMYAFSDRCKCGE